MNSKNADPPVNIHIYSFEHSLIDRKISLNRPLTNFSNYMACLERHKRDVGVQLSNIKNDNEKSTFFVFSKC